MGKISKHHFNFSKQNSIFEGGGGRKTTEWIFKDFSATQILNEINFIAWKTLKIHI